MAPPFALPAAAPAPIPGAPQPTIPIPPPVSAPSVEVRVNRMIMASLESVGFIIFPRLLLLLALAGAFVLGVLAMARQTPIGLEILIAFTALTVGPLAWLERTSRRG